jgi:hypothetical protein
MEQAADVALVIAQAFVQRLAFAPVSKGGHCGVRVSGLVLGQRGTAAVALVVGGR